jgi:ELWxxDGT repeat protein
LRSQWSGSPSRGAATRAVELWRTDGTPAGTTLVADLLAGPESSYPCGFTWFGGRLFFTATGYPRYTLNGYNRWTRRLWALEP